MKHFLLKTPSLTRKEDIAGKNFNKQLGATQKKMFRTLYCAKRLNSTCSQADLGFHIAIKHSLSQEKNIHKCQLCHHFVAGFNPLLSHRQKVYKAPNVSETTNVDVTQLVTRVTLRH